MKIAIIGAGISGLAAAYRLKQLGKSPTVYERHSRIGGRAATTIDGDFIFDSGATSIAPRKKTIEKVMLQELDTTDLVQVEKPIWTHSGLRVTSGSVEKNVTPRYAYKPGMRQFGNLLARGIDIKTDTEVQEIRRVSDKYEVNGEIYDFVILTLPIPQTCQLLWTLNESRPLANVTYRSCISVMIGYADQAVQTSYHAIIDPEQIHPLTWLSIESAKSPGRAPADGAAFVAQLSARFSHQNYAQPDEFFTHAVTSFVKTLYGDRFATPKVARVKKWKYSQPESLARFENVNPLGSTLIIASDGLVGGHIEDAFEGGWRAAEMVV